MEIFSRWTEKTPADPHKLSIPEPVACLSRQRLFKQLDAGQQPLIWIHSPAGAGKTVLAADYARHHQLPVLWYAIDWRDEDLASFFHHFRLAATAAFGEHDDKLPPFGPLYADGIDAYAAQYFNHLFAMIQSPTLLVLDNYERLSAVHPLHVLLARQVETARPGLRWMILSREAAPAAFTPAAKQALDWKQLQLTPSESRALLKLRGITESKRVDELHALAGGWAAALDLLAVDNADTHFHSADFDALADAMLARLPVAQRQLLLKLALLPSFTDIDAQHLGESAHVAPLLAELAQTLPLIKPIKGKVLRYQFHALLRDHLLIRLQQGLPPDQLQQVQRKAAGLLAAQGEIDEAAQLYQASASWPQLSDLIRQHARRYESSGREHVLQRWLAALPKELMESDPWLQHWWAIAIMAEDPEAAQRHLSAAFDLFFARRDSHGAYAVFTAATTSFSLTLHDFTPLIDWLRRYDTIRTQLPRCLDVELRVRAASARILALAVINPGHPRLSRLARWGEYLIRLLPLRHIRVIVGGQLAHYYAFTGQNPQLLAVAARMEADLDDPQVPPLPRLHAQAMVGLARYICGHPDAEAAHNKVLQIATATGVHLLDPLAKGILIDYYLHRNDLDEAQRRLQTLRATTNTAKKYEASHLEFLTGWHAALRGDVPLAIEHTRLAKQLSQDTSHPFSTDVTRALLVQLYADLNDWENAERELAEIHTSLKDANLHVARLLSLQSEAWLALRQHDEPRALRSLRAAFALGRDTQSIGQLNWRHDVGLALCMLALEHDIETGYAIRLIRHYKLQPSEPPLHLERWPWPVRIYTLGRTSLLLAEGDAEPQAGARAVDLLHAIIALGGRQVDMDELAAALWPDSDGDSAHRALETALHRLRKIIGKEQVLVKDRQISLNPRTCWVDAWALLRLCSQIESVLAAKAGNAQLDPLLHKLLSSYRGAFLAQQSAPWAVIYRERIKARILKVLRDAAAYLENADQHKLAITLLDYAIDIDPLAESSYLRLMHYLAVMGRRAEALSAYRRCQRVISAGQGVALSAEMETFARSLQ
ncbi:MAG TPA: BTAD domain-containing putative transcriptional regulator [Gammaproteobacteria bacterium]